MFPSSKLCSLTDKSLSLPVGKWRKLVSMWVVPHGPLITHSKGCNSVGWGGMLIIDEWHKYLVILRRKEESMVVAKVCFKSSIAFNYLEHLGLCMLGCFELTIIQVLLSVRCLISLSILDIWFMPYPWNLTYVRSRIILIERYKLNMLKGLLECCLLLSALV